MLAGTEGVHCRGMIYLVLVIWAAKLKLPRLFPSFVNAEENRLFLRGWDCWKELTDHITSHEIRDLSLLLITNPTSTQLLLFKACCSVCQHEADSRYLSGARINFHGICRLASTRVSFCIPTIDLANTIKINLKCSDRTNTGKRCFSGACLQLNRFVLVGSLYVGMEEEDLGRCEFGAYAPSLVSCVIMGTCCDCL